MKVLVTEDVSPVGIDLLRADPRVEVDIRVGMSKEELYKTVADYDAIITRSGTTVDAALLDHGKKLKLVARAGVGIDNIDVDYASSKGIIVVNAPFGNTNSAAEHTMAIMLARLRNVVDAGNNLKGGAWKRSPFTGHELKHKVLGIIGLGKVGGRVATRAKAFEAEVIACDPYIPQKRGDDLGVPLVSLDEIVTRSDIISVHTPLNDETRGMISEEQFARMKDGVYVINCARGGIIKESAMLEALESGKVYGGAFDVWSSEPPNDEVKRLIAHPRMVVTPHLGANTFEAQINVSVDVCRDILRYLDDKPMESAVNVPKFDAALMGTMKPYLHLAHQIGCFLAQLAPVNPDKITFSYNGKLAENDCQPLTVCGLTALLNRRLTQDVNMVNALMVAQEIGLEIDEQRSTESEFFSNLITMTVEGSGERKIVAGTLFEGNPRIVQMRDFRTDFQPEGVMLVMSYQDRPGMLGKIGTILGEAGVNIASMNLGRREKAGEAMVVFSLDSGVDEDVLKQLSKAVNASFVRVVDMM